MDPKHARTNGVFFHILDRADIDGGSDSNKVFLSLT